MFLDRRSDFEKELAPLGWPKCFVKDHVKSLTTARGSVADSPAEVAHVVDLLENYRGKIEGGICVRRFEFLQRDTEERYFVAAGQPFGRDGNVPPIVHDIAARIASPFFTADIVQATDGTPRLIELGDGQVSDRKTWPVDRFVEVLKYLSTMLLCLAATSSVFANPYPCGSLERERAVETAAQGDAEAMYWIGSGLDIGECGAADKRAGMEMLRASAAQGFPPAEPCSA